MDRSDRIFAAIGFRLTSVLTFTIMSVVIQLAERRGATLPELLFFRQAGAIPVVLASVIAGPGLKSLHTRRIAVHALRTAVGLISMSCMFATLIMLPLAEATTLQFTVPIFTTILGALVLGEMVGIHRWSAVIVGFLGVIIVAQPGSEHIPLLGATTGLLAALFSATVSILLRQIGLTERPATIVFYFSLLSLVPLTPLFVWSAMYHHAMPWALLVLTGLIGGVGQLAMTKSLSLAPVSVVVPVDYSGLIWAILLGWLVFRTLPTSVTWIGALIIVFSGLYIVWRAHRLSRANALAMVASAQ